MMIQPLNLICAVLFFAASKIVFAQVAAIPLQPAQEVLLSEELEVEADEPASDSAETTPENASDSTNKQVDAAAEQAKKEAAEKAAKLAAEKKRMEKIKKLKFDRRTSTALSLWGTPPKEKKTDEKKQTGESETDTDTKASPKPELTEAQKKIQAEEQKFDDDLKLLIQNVTLGNWPPVAEFVKSLPQEQGKAIFDHLLRSLAEVPQGKQIPDFEGLGGNVDAAVLASAFASQGRGQGAQFRERHFFNVEDFFGVVSVAPKELDEAQINQLGRILRQTVALGHDIEVLLARLHEESAKESGLLTKRESGKMLFAAREQIRAGQFLPTAEEAEQENDREALNLISRHAMAKYDDEKKVEYLEQAWAATQSALAAGEIDEEEKQQALRRAVELAPKIRDELGKSWLDDSFIKRIERGKEILATIGSGTSTGMQTYPTNAPQRLKGLELQRTAVDALLKADPSRAKSWRNQLILLANNWLREAEHSYRNSRSSSMSPQLRRDRYGNYFYFDDNEYSQRTVSRAYAIATPDIIECRPSAAWLEIIDASLQPRFQYMFAQLYLKVNEENLAFPYIEKFAKVQPAKALELAHEFLNVWTNNHNPNQNRRRTNYYMFMYGYDQRADQIPLTRSKQERNLKELAEWIERLNALDIGELDEQVLVKAFTTCHSNAEVYKLESLEQVFGSVQNLDPQTLAEMIQKMRANLAGIWRTPAVQNQNKTKRRKADIQSEILRGYSVANEVLGQALDKHPDNWRLMLAKASIMHDENDYQQELKKSSQFAENRRAALNLFRNSAETYIATIPDLAEDEESTRPFELWYYASLGAVDLGRIRENDEPALAEISKIKTTLKSVQGPAGERHLAQFANSLFTRMSAVKPEMKFRYLRTGLQIVGDHKQAREAQKVYSYYKDLVTEIKLVTRLDNPSTRMGHQTPFGLWVDITHTKEIERESGGFSKYLQNQNNMRYAYNYGRPTENYRDKFEESVNKSLNEHFEVLSVTFNAPETKSHALPEYGWRVTPYAYLLLKPRGPEVDKIPALQIDFDFLDTSGYAIIPVESAAIPIDASDTKVAERPFSELKVVQTLDERQADEGNLILEIKATANGLVPDLDHFTKLETADFEVASIDDQGVTVKKFDQEDDQRSIISERIWNVSLKAKTDLAEKATKFQFPDADLQDVAMTFQRYVDEDLEEVESSILLTASYGELKSNGPWMVAASVAGITLIVFFVWALSRRTSRQMSQESMTLPDEITPFTVLGLLKQIESNNGMSQAKRQQLADSIRRLEQHFFVEPEEDTPDLRSIAESWLQQSA